MASHHPTHHPYISACDVIKNYPKWWEFQLAVYYVVGSLKVAKSMAYIINESGGEFQQGGYLYKSASRIHWTAGHSWTSDRPQKHILEKADQSTFHWCCGN